MIDRLPAACSRRSSPGWATACSATSPPSWSPPARLFVGVALSWPIFLGFLAGDRHAQRHSGAQLGRVGRAEVDWALRVDALTAVMLVVVTTVSALVHLY